MIHRTKQPITQVWRVTFRGDDRWNNPDCSTESSDVRVAPGECLETEIRRCYDDWHTNEHCRPHKVEWLAWDISHPDETIAARVEDSEVAIENLRAAIYETADETGEFSWSPKA